MESKQRNVRLIERRFESALYSSPVSSSFHTEPPERPVIVDARRGGETKLIEPYNEGSDVVLICQVQGGEWATPSCGFHPVPLIPDLLSICPHHPITFTWIPGRPRPNVTWYLDNTIIDASFERRPDGVTVNHLLFPNVGRQHLNARLVCIASNTNISPPNSRVVVLEVYCEFQLFLPLRPPSESH